MRSIPLAFFLCLLPVQALAQAVTPAELEGLVVESKVIMDQEIAREGRQFPVQVHHQVRISFLPDNRIEYTLAATSHGPRGARPGPTRKGTAVLGKPAQSKTLGGGDFVWLFEDSTLITLRTYAGAGGYKRTIAFARAGDKITCTARDSFVREEGVGRVALRSAIDDTPVTILRAKQASSTCRVLKR